MNIILIGMPGSGKTSIGKNLAKKLDMGFIDTDKLIEKEYGNIREIIKKKGDNFFCKIEEELLKRKLWNTENSVISTGGSVVLKPDLIEFFRSLGKIVYLEVSYKEIEYRIKYLRKSQREIVGISHGLEKVYLQRKPLYERYADIIFYTEKRIFKKHAERLAEIVLKQYH